MRDPTLKDECSCGHERDSHHDKQDNCLAMHCDCRTFAKPGVKKTSALRPVDSGPITPRISSNKPHNDTTCNCGPCCEWLVRKWRDPWSVL